MAHRDRCRACFRAADAGSGAVVGLAERLHVPFLRLPRGGGHCFPCVPFCRRGKNQLAAGRWHRHRGTRGIARAGAAWAERRAGGVGAENRYRASDERRAAPARGGNGIASLRRVGEVVGDDTRAGGVFAPAARHRGQGDAVVSSAGDIVAQGAASHPDQDKKIAVVVMGERSAAGNVGNISDAHCRYSGRCESDCQRSEKDCCGDRQVASKLRYAHSFSVSC